MPSAHFAPAAGASRNKAFAGCRYSLIVLSALWLAGCGLLNWSEPPPPPRHHASSPRPASRPVNTPTEYVVERGDTMYSIAFRNQLDYHDIASWNGIGRDYHIQIGQRLRLTPPPGINLPAPIASGSVQTQTSPRPNPPVAAAGSSKPPIANSSRPVPPVSAPSAPVQTAGDNDAPVSTWQWPTEGGVIERYDPDGGQKGIDITGSAGQVVVASAPGKVVYSGSALKGYGELVIVKHNEVYLSAYGYNRRRLVEEGAQVAAGQPIAELGMGPEQKPVLHFEIREKGRPIDPIPLLPRH